MTRTDLLAQIRTLLDRHAAVTYETHPYTLDMERGWIRGQIAAALALLGDDRAVTRAGWVLERHAGGPLLSRAVSDLREDVANMRAHAARRAA